MAIRRKRTPFSVKLAIPLVAGVAVAAGGALVFLSLQSGPSEQKKLPEEETSSQIDILVATQNIEAGVELKPTLFRKESRERRDLLEANLIVSFEQLRGVFAKSFIPAGQPLVAEYVTSKPPINSLVPKIRPGFRAITLILDKQTTNEGWARAGVRVDVLVAMGAGLNTTATIIAQNLRVLSSGTSVDSAFGGESKIVQDGQSTVTLEVSAEDQKRLKLAAGQGELRLLLRGDEDTLDAPENLEIALGRVLPLGDATPSDRPSDQGWVVIDGQRYRVVGAGLLPE